MADPRRIDDKARLEGPLICICDIPLPEQIPLFDAWQCRRCLRKLCYTPTSGSTNGTTRPSQH